MRIPDLAFTSWKRFPGGKIPRDSICPVAPELAVEVVSKSNTKKEMQQMRIDYFGHGVLQVWEIDPKTQSVAVFSNPDSFSTVTIEGKLSGGDILPGFEVSVAEIFGPFAADPEVGE